MTSAEHHPEPTPTPDLVADIRDALTPDQVAELLGVTPRSVATRIKRGEIACFEPFLGRRLITRSELNRWLATTRMVPRARAGRAVRNPGFAQPA